ncbi:MAG: cytochrome C [Candidatus Desantisbacteria bacterium]
MSKETNEKVYGLMAAVDGKSNLQPKNPDECTGSWPSLVYRELICAIIVTSCFILISVLFNAPLEEQANPTITPNPAKAPWYFLGLQELLVYFDPWIAGVVVPSVILIGLMMIPYIDVNREGTGEYCLKKRPYAWLFIFGYVMWFVLIFIGSCLRGPGWNIFWPWEEWDIHKVVAVTTLNLSEVFGISFRTPWYLRELPGLILLLVYFIGIPLVITRIRKGFLASFDIVRKMLLLALTMGLFFVPIKILLRLVFEIKYVLVTPWFSI